MLEEPEMMAAVAVVAEPVLETNVSIVLKIVLPPVAVMRSKADDGCLSLHFPKSKSIF